MRDVSKDRCDGHRIRGRKQLRQNFRRSESRSKRKFVKCESDDASLHCNKIFFSSTTKSILTSPWHDRKFSYLNRGRTRNFKTKHILIPQKMNRLDQFLFFQRDKKYNLQYRSNRTNELLKSYLTKLNLFNHNLIIFLKYLL